MSPQSFGLALLLTFLVSCGVDGTACETAINRQVLNELFASTSGNSWLPAARVNWNTTNDVSTWNGVTCSSSGFVTNLLVTGSNLAGTLPSSIGLLNQLRTLDLSNNQLNGTLPAAWSSLTALTRLGLDQNQLTGTLPAAWSSLTALTQLYLSQNQLTGTLTTPRGPR